MKLDPAVDPADPVIAVIADKVRNDLKKNKRGWGIPAEWDADEVAVVVNAAVVSTLRHLTSPAINLFN